MGDGGDGGAVVFPDGGPFGVAGGFGVFPDVVEGLAGFVELVVVEFVEGDGFVLAEGPIGGGVGGAVLAQMSVRMRVEASVGNSLLVMKVSS